MKKIFGSIFDIRKGEIALTLLMFLNYYLLLVTYYFLKPARDSLFLVKVSPEMLPLVFIITALVTAPVVSLYSRASRKMPMNRLINFTTLIIIVNLFVLRWLVTINQPWIYYMFYTWVSIYGALTTSQFWLMANAVFDSAQAKRVFALIGLGGILGAFTGGEVTSIVVKYFDVSTENLLFICMALLGVTSVLVIIVWRKWGQKEVEIKKATRKRSEVIDNVGKVVSTIFRSRHLTLTVGIIAMTMMVASFVDFQFKTVSYQTFPDKASLTSFLGVFYGRLSLVSLVLQLVLTYRFIRILGVGGVIMFLPIGLTLGSLAMLIYPGLISAILLRGADGSLKYSIDKTGRELLFLPIPLEIKKRTKIFIDMFVDRWFRGLAGGLLLLLTLVFKLSVQQISIVVLVLLAIWLVMTVFMRREYINSFRKAIEKREIDLSSLPSGLNDKSTVKTLVAALKSNNERQVSYALEMLSSAEGIKIADDVVPLLNHKSAEIRDRAIRILQKQADESLDPKMEELIADENIKVRREAIKFLALNAGEQRHDRMKALLTYDDPKVQHGALACIGKYGDDDEKALIDKTVVERILNDDSDDAEAGRVQLAYTIGVLDNPEYNAYLDRLLRDSSINVIRAAIDSVGRLNQRQYIPWLVERLSNRELRVDTRNALAQFGTGVLGTLSDYFQDRNIDYNIRKAIPRVMRQIPKQQTVDILTGLLDRVEASLKLYVVKALNSLRSKYDDLKFDEEKIEPVLIDETREYYEIYQILYSNHSFDKSEASQLLKRALEEKQRFNLERIFRLMGLVYPPHDIFYAYQGFVSGQKALQANAIEFLDNVLQRDVKKYVLPILDDLPVESVIRKGEELFKIRFKSREEALEKLIQGRDVWLQCCAIYASAGIKSKRLDEIVDQLTDHPDPIIRETAGLSARERKERK